MFSVAQYFTSSAPNTPDRNKPILTSAPFFASTSRLSMLRTSYRAFWEQFRRSPELIAVLSTIVTDTIGDRPEWVGVDGKKLGRNKRLQAERFWRRNRGKKVLESVLYDMLLCGDGYIWKGKPSQSDVRRAFKEALATYGVAQTVETKELDVLYKEADVDEEFNSTKIIEAVAATTVKILNDYYEVKGYIQMSNGKTAEFSTKDIIHFKYMDVNGQVEGFSPVESLVAELTLLWLVKGNMLAFMKNGGSPDKVFILPKEIAGSKNADYLVEVLRKYNRVENRHGNLVFTGEVQIEDLQGSPKDLEYKDLALYITSNLAFAYGIPVSRIPYLIGTSANKGDSGGLSEAGYWNRISMGQDSIEDLMNEELFEPMGWHMKLPRKYKQDEVREAQTKQMMTAVVLDTQKILAAQGVALSQEKTLSLLGLADDDVEDISPEMQNILNPPQMPVGASGRQGLATDQQVNKEPDAQKRAATKSNTQKSKDSGVAAHKP